MVKKKLITEQEFLDEFKLLKLNMIKKISDRITVKIEGPNIEFISQIIDVYAKLLKEKLSQLDDPTKELMGNNIFKEALGLEREKSSKHYWEYKRNEEFIDELFKHTKEIHDSFKRMELSIKLLNNIGSIKDVKKDTLLAYYNENFVNELFIYCERIKKLILDIESKAQKLKQTKNYNTLVKLRNDFHETFEPLKSVRNSHNHKQRVKFELIDKLNTTEFYNMIFDDPTFKRYTKYKLITTKKHTSTTLKKTLQHLEKTSDVILKQVGDILFKDILPKL